MCGIIGILSNDYSIDFLINGLKQLQNRGYDSAGIACFNDNNEVIAKKYASTDESDSLKKLSEETEFFKNCKIGIGHTRWATHGSKTDTNSHPHFSQNNIFTIVHNGIIENFKELKERLEKDGFEFQTETDTEIIANLLEYNYSQKIKLSEQINTKLIKEIIKETVNELQGTWGLAILFKDTPNVLYLTRNGSPILVGQENSFVAISSEAAGFCGKVKSYFCLENNDICIIEKNEKNITIDTEKNYKDNSIKNNSTKGNLTPEPYPHWTIKEIEEQSDSILRALNLGGRLMTNNSVILGGLTEKRELLKQAKNIVLLGCGTSLNSAIFCCKSFKRLCNFNTVQVYDGAEFEQSDISKEGKTCFILVSQSGETKDLHRCINIINETDNIILGVVNVPDSLIARESHCGVYLNAGREVAVASTKAFTSQIVVLSLIAIWFSQIHNSYESFREEHIIAIRQLTTQVKETIDMCKPICEKLAKELKDKPSMFILGKDKSYAIAREGSLKIKEITYIHAEGYPGSSLKHGPFGLLEKDFPVILMAPKDSTYAKMTNVYEEVKSRHAKVYFITDDKDCNYENKIVYPSNKHYNYLLSVIPLQLLAYYISLEKGYNPDFPRNLAKVVTVE